MPRMAGPNWTSPAYASIRKCRSFGPDSAKCGTSVQVCCSSPASTVRVSGASEATTGRRCRANRWAGVPSDRPRISPCTTSALIVGAVPPIVCASIPITVGDST